MQDQPSKMFQVLVAPTRLLVLLFICTQLAEAQFNPLSIKITRPTPPTVTLPFINDKTKLATINEAKAILAAREAAEQNMIAEGIMMYPDEPGYLNSATKRITKKTEDEAFYGELSVLTAQLLAESQGLSVEQRRYGNNTYAANTFFLCREDIKCATNYKYRTYDGVCNNLRNPEWGRALTPFGRDLVSSYNDGLQEPRKASSGVDLPSPREVSLKATKTTRNPHDELTHMVMQWGQFIDHDITLTPIVSPEGLDISCCQNGTFRSENETHDACLAIPVAGDDPFYAQFGVSCMEFIRSASIMPRACNFGPREQINLNSAYIDASMVYGSDEESADFLRDPERRGGFLRVHKDGARDLLPPDLDSEEDCHNDPELPCFKAGDVRVNEQPDLAIIHTLFLREHNRVATELATHNPNWKDEILYQEARRIVGAEMQHITYNEWLPIILGEHYAEANGLLAKSRSYRYRSDVDATVSNEFATACFRFGHSMIQDYFEGFDQFREKDQREALGDLFFKNDALYTNQTFDSFLRGLTIQQCENFDRNVNKEVTTKLYKGNSAFGLDLVALNVQRGREHGLQPYIFYREACGLSVPQTFDDLSDFMEADNVEMLRNTYLDVKDIDLFIGGILEDPAPGAVVGETFRCMVGNQFERLKIGDRWFYENQASFLIRFTPEQLDELRKSSLSRIICDNGDDIVRMQRNAFRIAGEKFSCLDEQEIPRPDLRFWKV